MAAKDIGLEETHVSAPRVITALIEFPLIAKFQTLVLELKLELEA